MNTLGHELITQKSLSDHTDTLNMIKVELRSSQIEINLTKCPKITCIVLLHCERDEMSDTKTALKYTYLYM